MPTPRNLNEINFSRSGTGTALVWAHGLLGSMQAEDALGIYAWHRFPKDLSLLRYDAPGHGLTSLSTQMSSYLWANLADCLLDIVNQVSLDMPMIVGGQSMGAATAIYAALAEPEKVKAMILMNPPTAWETRIVQRDYYRKVAKAAKILGGKGLARINAKHIDRMLPRFIINAHKHSVLGMLDGLKSMKRQSLFQLFNAAAENDLPDKAVLKKLTMPCLILAWAEDETHPLSTANTLAECLPNAKLMVADNMSDVEDWPEAISAFCQQVTR